MLNLILTLFALAMLLSLVVCAIYVVVKLLMIAWKHKWGVLQFIICVLLLFVPNIDIFNTVTLCVIIFNIALWIFKFVKRAKLREKYLQESKEKASL